MPVAHGEGRFYADDATLDALERDGQVIFRYVDGAGELAGPDDPANPNGSLRAIAGVMNAAGNVAGLMPHPERASEAILGSDDGFGIIRSLVESASRAANEPAVAMRGVAMTVAERPVEPLHRRLASPTTSSRRSERASAAASRTTSSSRCSA